jgi:hypothetical protein
MDVHKYFPRKRWYILLGIVVGALLDRFVEVSEVAIAVFELN